MFELSAANAAEYLGYPCTATCLGGGVSNTVVLIEAGERRFVLKQSLGKLRVDQDWFSDRGRIYREASAMRQLAAALPAGSVPGIVFEDQENFLFAMTAAGAEGEPWKDKLLRGEVDSDTAATVGSLLGALIQTSWKNAEMAAEFGDQTIFDELRLDPYYRSTALKHPDLAAEFSQLMDVSGRRRMSLVHGDWSPKNLLVSETAVMVIDFEVVHFGDPSFDAAFLLNHLLLKSVHRPEFKAQFGAAAVRFWNVLSEWIPKPADWFEPATIQHLGALLMARVDGKSPAEYIRDPSKKAALRVLARDLIVDPPRRVTHIFA